MDHDERNNIDNASEFPYSGLSFFYFLKSAWKALVAASFLGAALGFTAWVFFSSYSAEYTLINNRATLDVVTFRTLQKKLPLLASQAIDKKFPDYQAIFFRIMTSGSWWQKNVTPIYSVNKDDIKGLSLNNKEFEIASNTISSIRFTALGSSEDEALKNTVVAANFFRSGGTYIQIRNLLMEYDNQVYGEFVSLGYKLTQNHNEISYLQTRVNDLEELRKRFPSTPGTSVSQLVNNSDSGNKFLPLTSQIIAVNTEINQLKEDSTRIQNRLAQLEFLKRFLGQALILADQTADGLLLVDKLQEVLAGMESSLPKSKTNEKEILDRINKDMLQIKASFSKGLDTFAAPISSGKNGFIKLVFGGSATVFFLAFILLFARRIWDDFSGASKEWAPK